MMETSSIKNQNTIWLDISFTSDFVTSGQRYNQDLELRCAQAISRATRFRKQHPIQLSRPLFQSESNLHSPKERTAFVQCPELLNRSTFEPKLIRSAIPYVQMSRRNSQNHVPMKKEVTIDASSSSAPAPPKGESQKRKSKSKHLRRRYNSMQTLHVSSLLHSPDQVEIIRSFACALWGMIKQSEDVETPVFIDIYSELYHPLGKGIRLQVPTLEVVQEFVIRLYMGIALAPENCVMALAYIERLIALTNITVHPINWRRITVAALLLASKVWEDLAVHNRDLLRVFPQMNLKNLMALECALLEHLKFTVSLRASVYAKYYFELRTLSQVDTDSFPLKPLSYEKALFIEFRSRGLEKKVAPPQSQGKRRRARSLGSSRDVQISKIGFEDYQSKIALHRGDSPHNQ